MAIFIKNSYLDILEAFLEDDFDFGFKHKIHKISGRLEAVVIKKCQFKKPHKNSPIPQIRHPLVLLQIPHDTCDHFDTFLYFYIVNQYFSLGKLLHIER